jgi:hypothetical protein
LENYVKISVNKICKADHSEALVVDGKPVLKSISEK